MNSLKFALLYFILLASVAWGDKVDSAAPVSDNNLSMESVQKIVSTNDGLYVLSNTSTQKLYKYETNLTKIYEVNLTSDSKDISIDDDIFVSYQYNNNVDIFDKNDGTKKNTLTTSANLQDFVVKGGYLYGLEGTNLTIYDLNTQQKTAQLNLYSPSSIAFYKDVLYVADKDGLKVIDVENKNLPTILSTINGEFLNVKIDGATLYAHKKEYDSANTLYSEYIQLYDISSPKAPNFVLQSDRFDSIEFYDVYAQHIYLKDNNGNFYIYDTGDKKNMEQKYLNSNAYSYRDVTATTNSFFLTYDNYPNSKIEKYTYTNDYDDIATDINDKSLLVNGINGVLDGNDTDSFLLNLEGGILHFSFVASDDTNFTVTDENNNTIVDYYGKKRDISNLITQGVYKFTLKTDNNSSEYSLEMPLSNDDYPNSASEAKLYPTNNVIEGTIDGFSDLDYVRYDIYDHGRLKITFNQPTDNSLKVILTDGINTASPLYANGSYYFDIKNTGSYFLGIYTDDRNVNNQNYSVKVEFLKSTQNNFEDDADAGFTHITDSNKTDTNHDYQNIFSDSKNIFVIDNYNGVRLNKLSLDLTTVSNSYDFSGGIQSIEQIGEYIYVVLRTYINGSDSLVLTILNKNLTLISQTPLLTINNLQNRPKIKINGDRAYLDVGTKIYQIDISDKANPAFNSNVFIDLNDNNSSDNYDYNINDYDLKAIYDKKEKQNKYYLYFATNKGISTYEINETDFKQSSEVSKYTKTYGFGVNTVKVVDDYAYVSANGSFYIFNVKVPTSTPKLTSYLNNLSFRKIQIAGDFAYLITESDNYLHIVNIASKTAPAIVLLKDSIQTQDFCIANHIGYYTQIYKDPNDSSINPSNHANYIASYDVEKDYSDYKSMAKKIEFDTPITGFLSKNRADTDMFYFKLDVKNRLNIELNSTKNLDISIKNFIDDTVSKTFSSATDVNDSVVLDKGEYYLEIKSSNPTVFDTSYHFNLLYQTDDFPNETENAEKIDIAKTVDGKIDSGFDKDCFYFEITDRGEVNIKNLKTDSNLTVELFYDDGKTLVKEGNDTVDTVLNPGKYYVQLSSDNNATYSMQIDFTKDNNLIMPDGLKDKEAIALDHITFSNRYIYAIDDHNRLLIYNHLLDRLDYGNIDGGYMFSAQCCKPIFYNDKIFINTSYGDGKCSGAFISIDTQDIQDHSLHTGDYGGNLLTIKDGYYYLYDNGYIEKMSFDDSYNIITKYKTDIDFYDIDASTAKRDKFIIFHKNNVTIVDMDNYLSTYDTNNNLVQTNEVNNSISVPIPSKYLDGYFEGEDYYFIIENNSSLLKLSDIDTATPTVSTVTDLGLSSPSDLYRKDDKLYVSSSSQGIKIFDANSFKELKYIENLGKNVSNVFSYDGSTVNYTDANELKVYFLSKSFTDGSSDALYSVADESQVNEGCFIATAAYGSYFEKHVKVLRDFRDKVLLKFSLGKEFVRLYYKYSPPIAKKIAKSEIAKSIIRITLTPVVYMIKYYQIFFGFIFVLIVFRFRKILIPQKRYV